MANVRYEIEKMPREWVVWSIVTRPCIWTGEPRNYRNWVAAFPTQEGAAAALAKARGEGE